MWLGDNNHDVFGEYPMEEPYSPILAVILVQSVGRFRATAVIDHKPITCFSSLHSLGIQC